MTGPGRRGPPRQRAAAPEPDLFGHAAAVPEPRRDVAPGEEPESALTVSTLVRTAQEILEGAFFPLWIRGEVSDFKRHRNGHWYFCLRDEKSLVRCVVWSRDQWRIPAAPDEGMQIVAFGRLGVYTARGEMQFTVARLDAVGDGLWRKALDTSLKRLTAEGLIDPARRRPLPRLPLRIAVVTSPDGAALRDIIAVVRRRCPIVEIVVCPAAVQGESAPLELARAIRRVGRWGAADVVIVGRGGGSREDLWAFNDERVARALATCPIPTISAVGHEVDVSLTDLVADLRAPTPSAAAEAAVPVLSELRTGLDALRVSLRGALARRATLARRDLVLHQRRLTTAALRTVERRRARWDRSAGRLHALSPLAVLGRGYAIARRADDGAALSDTIAFAPGLPFRLLLRDGEIDARTEQVRPAAPDDARSDDA
jgi:exodeoxyribonuclease VII large subunit